MRILLDECVPRRLKTHFPGHECRTAAEAGFAGKANGELLHLAETGGYHVLLTVDRGIQHQMNMRGRSISVVILGSKSNRFQDLLALVPDCLDAFSKLGHGEILKLSLRP